MKLQEAVVHCFEKAKELGDCKSGREYQRFGEMLKELKKRREVHPTIYACWVEVEVPRYLADHCYLPKYDCSSCGSEARCRYPYCPHCGAKMGE